MAARKDQQLFGFRLDDQTARALKVRLAQDGIKLQVVMETYVRAYLARVPGLDVSEVRAKTAEATGDTAE